MNVYQVLIIVLVLFILLYELVPPAQAEIRNAFCKGRERLDYLRAFIDDEDYDAVGHFRNNPFTMGEYLGERERLCWTQVRKRARARQRQGWGSVHFDGPDFSAPYEFWWKNGCLIRRRVPRYAPASDKDASWWLGEPDASSSSSSSSGHGRGRGRARDLELGLARAVASPAPA